MALYRIPLYERFTQIGDSPLGTQKCLHIDEVGLFVTYPSGREDLLTPENIRRHLIGRRRTWCYVEADSPEKAIETFYKEWDGAKIGGDKTPEHKALWIANTEHDEPIGDYPYCEEMHKNKNGEFICGEDNGEDGNGIGGMCVLEGYDPFDGCVVHAYNEIKWRLEEEKKLPVKLLPNGLKYVTVADVLKVAKQIKRKDSKVLTESKESYEVLQENIAIVSKAQSSAILEGTIL
jgi:hypothetical protein